MIFNSIDIPKALLIQSSRPREVVIRKTQIRLWDQFTSHMLKVFLRSSGAQATKSGPSSEPNAPYIL
jgi:hypothetical protein